MNAAQRVAAVVAAFIGGLAGAAITFYLTNR